MSCLSAQSTKTLPDSLQPSRVAPKKLVRRNVHPANATPVNVVALRRLAPNSHDSNVAPLAVASVMSTSRNVHPSKRRPVRSRAYQSSSTKVSAVNTVLGSLMDATVGRPTDGSASFCGDLVTHGRSVRWSRYIW